MAIHSHAALGAWLRGPLRDAIHHQSALVLHGAAHSLGFVIEEKIRVDLPESYLAAISDARGQLRDPLLDRWMLSRTPQYFDAADACEHVEPRWLREFEAHGLKNCALF